ncbi:hypothetical protein [Caloranaerobacter sp. TR13]|uniref:hypothetical protein n=1 Tax=Caloranaerobacter sp. TR13 TaxID=1302151 RepID=UPI00350F84D3
MIILIQIDDAGSGSLVGGTCIGAMRVETSEFYYDIIPIKYYSKENFKNKYYLEHVVTIVKDLFKKLNVDKNEKILVCRGYMFDNLRKWLSNKNYNYESVSIGEPLQTKIETTFEEYMIQLGLPMAFIRYTKYPFHFHKILKWVYADYENRYHLCKTGWKSWEKYGNLQTEVSIQFLNKSNFVCLKCGKSIPSNSVVKVIKYTSNKPTTIYLHKDC